MKMDIKNLMEEGGTYRKYHFPSIKQHTRRTVST